MKVQNTRIIGQTLVADGELVLVECEQNKASISQVIGSLQGNYYLGNSNGHFKYLKPTIISRTEKIEDRDWVYDSKTGLIEQLDKRGGSVDYINSRKDKWFKILTFPEQFSPTDLQRIVDGKLKEGKIAVECEIKNTHPHHDPEEHTFGISQDITVVKLNSQGHVKLHEVEEKMYTRDQNEKHIADFVEYMFDKNWSYNNYQQLRYKISEWFEQNVK